MGRVIPCPSGSVIDRSFVRRNLTPEESSLASADDEAVEGEGAPERIRRWLAISRDYVGVEGVGISLDPRWLVMAIPRVDSPIVRSTATSRAGRDEGVVRPEKVAEVSGGGDRSTTTTSPVVVAGIGSDGEDAADIG